MFILRQHSTSNDQTSPWSDILFLTFSLRLKAVKRCGPAFWAYPPYLLRKKRHRRQSISTLTYGCVFKWRPWQARNAALASEVRSYSFAWILGAHRSPTTSKCTMWLVVDVHLLQQMLLCFAYFQIYFSVTRNSVEVRPLKLLFTDSSVRAISLRRPGIISD